MIYLVKRELRLTDDRLIAVSEEEAHYLFKVRRVGREEPVFFYHEGVVYETALAEMSRKEGLFEVRARHDVSPRGRRVFVVMAAIEWSRLEEAVRNGVEAGAHGFFLFRAGRSNVPETAMLKRVQRIEQIIVSAASQSQRRCLPDMRGAGREVIVKRPGRHIVFHPEADRPVTPEHFAGDGDLYLWIGPEGGFDESDLCFFERAGLSFASLRTPVLRVENAVTVAVGLARHAVGYTTAVTLPE